MDLVRVLETYCNDNDIIFMYGSKSHLNLVQREEGLDADKVHLLLFPVKRISKSNDLGIRIKANEYVGQFFLVVNSNMDLHYFNERNQDQATSKFTTNIEPLITQHTAIGNALLGCNYSLEVEQWDCIDAIDVLDANLDGIWCNFKITQDV